MQTQLKNLKTKYDQIHGELSSHLSSEVLKEVSKFLEITKSSHKQVQLLCKHVQTPEDTGTGMIENLHRYKHQQFYCTVTYKHQEGT